MFKRDKSFRGLDCLNDMENPLYTEYMNALQAAVSWESQAQYAKATVYFGVVVIFIAFLKNVWFRYVDTGYKKKPQGMEPGYFGSLVAIITAFCRLVGYKPVEGPLQKWLSLPSSMGNFLFAACSSLYLACYCFIPHFWYRECRGFGSPPLAVRAGVMAAALMPFIYVMAGKSNAICMLTGILYEKLNVLHQFVGVACFVLGVVHTIPFIWQDLSEGGAALLNANFQTYSYYSGIPPLILLGILCIGGNHWFRAHAYEIFLHLHWVCGCGFFGTMVWHIGEMLGMWDYMWGTLAFWMAQLIYRALVKTCFKPTAFFLRARPATISKLTGEAYEICVANVGDRNWSPGQHCYLRFKGSRILDNHPFLICSLPSESQGNDACMRFIVLPQKGLTRKMYNELNTVTNTRVYIDGPYGGTVRDSAAFDQVMLFSTGTGVSACLPFLQHLARAIAQKTAVMTKQVHFTWIVRHSEDIDWIKDELEETIKLAADCITINIYVCHDNAEDEVAAGSAYKESIDLEKSVGGLEKSACKGLNVFSYKPDVTAIMVQLSSQLMRKTMIVSSGSASMRREVGAAAASMQKAVLKVDSHAPVEEVFLHTETFGW